MAAAQGEMVALTGVVKNGGVEPPNQTSGTREGAPGFLGLNAVDRFGHLQHDLGARSHVILQLSGGPGFSCICPCAVKILQQFWGCQAIIFFFFHFFIITLSFSYEYT